ncbi:MAG TPA: pyrroloquinoline quinone-dependent dehydrogenase [Bryobacteraceae bacterium]|jgi:quinoprotein glucose dehydrogenase
MFRQRLVAPFIVLLFVSLLNGQTDWPTYGHDPGSSRYSPLKQINTQTVSQVERAWTYHMAATPPPSTSANPTSRRRARSSEATPIVINGVLFMPTPYNRVVALNAETGQELWSYEVKGGQPSTRGVEYWPGDTQSPASIFFGTSDGRLISLNAQTGKPVPGFAVEGTLDMRQGVDNGLPPAGYGLSSPPKVFGNLVITGARTQESPSLGASGDTRAWDAHSGKLVWQFHSVPRPGETGSDTWQGDDWKNRSGVNVWGLFSIDTKLGLVYLPHGSPAYDFYGGDRKGANLFGNSLVALDALTGKLKWYFQAIHHDTWDYDLESAPILFDVTRSGEKIPALAITSKTGLVFILDRRDGKPIYGVEERSVPASDVPGEEGWKTEPFPVKPPPLGRMSFKPDEVAKVTPEHEKFCTELMASQGGMHNDGPFTRFGANMSIVFPGTLGAVNWHGGSFDPGLGYLFYNVNYVGDVGKVIKNPEGSRTPYSRTSEAGPYANFWNPDNYWPCQQPPWGQMVAINVNTGDIAWRVPLGVVDELEAKGIHDTGTVNMGGSVATAGGLVFIAATNDRHFRAFDSKTGKVLWDTKMETGGYASPLTYQAKNGKQYVVIVAAGSGYYDHTAGDSVIAYALP